MSWTNKREERLQELWADGFSASQIAGELGGVTRNAVIGKVHRLGLSGRAKPGATKVKKRASSKPQTSRPAAGMTTEAAIKLQQRRSPRAPSVNPESAVRQAERRVGDIVVPTSKRILLLELNESTCKWPTGDPTRPGFSFCGHKTADEKPYCEFHNKLAFQPPSERRRRRAA